MGKATLVVMAAGIGSRFGGGIKQLEPVGPNGEIIMDYSVYDAIEAGFDKVVFVIRRDLEKEFKEIIGNRIEKMVKVEYVFQELDAIPEKYIEKFKGRTKPWGTGQAILACKGVVNEPFLVINADDYYGKDAYRKAIEYLTTRKENEEIFSIGMVGFKLKNTLSDNGGVTRGVCQTDAQDMLRDIVETYNIIKTASGAISDDGEAQKELDVESTVSMNMWVLTPRFIEELEKGFFEFLEKIPAYEIKKEYLLPSIIGHLLKEEHAEVKVLRSSDKWFGVTYKEDKEFVVGAIRGLIANGTYPDKLC